MLDVCILPRLLVPHSDTKKFNIMNLPTRAHPLFQKQYFSLFYTLSIPKMIIFNQLLISNSKPYAA